MDIFKIKKDLRSTAIPHAFGEKSQVSFGPLATP